jgi:hypothetical protein
MRLGRRLFWGAGATVFALATVALLYLLLSAHAFWRRDAAEERAVLAVQKAGGEVIRDPTAPGEPVVRVFLRGAGVTDAHLKELAGLPHLQTLDLEGAAVTSAGLEHLATLTQLRMLRLRGTQVTNTGLKELAGLQQLHWLDLADTQVTWAGLKELVGLKELRRLSISRRQMLKDPDSPGRPRTYAVNELAQLQQLRELNFTSSAVKKLDGGDEMQAGWGAFLVALRNVLPHCRVTYGDK